MLFLYFFVLPLLQPIIAAPVPDTYVTWQSGPPGRGSWNIITSCLTTLFFCVFSAIHPNVPDGRSRMSNRFKRCFVVIGYMVIGFLFPETMLAMAWKQWYRARLLTQKVQDFKDGQINEPEMRPAVEKHFSMSLSRIRRTRTMSSMPTLDIIDEWSMAHSFFVVSGGFQFRPEVLQELVDEGELEESTIANRAVLTSAGFLNLLYSGHRDKIPPLSTKDLQDRSKADHFVKIVTCVQVVWFVVNLAQRLICHVTITEIEVNTCAHCLCALVMYLFWVEKPLAVKQPVWIETTGLETWVLLFSCFDMSERQLIASTKIEDRFGTSNQFVTHVHNSVQHDTDCHQCQINRTCRGGSALKGIYLEDSAQSLEETVEKLKTPDGSRYFIDFVVGDVTYLKETRKKRDVDVIRVKNVDVLTKLWPRLDELELTDERQHKLFLVRRSDMWLDQGAVGCDRKTPYTKLILTLESGFQRHGYATSAVKEDEYQECSSRLEFFTFGIIMFAYGCLHGALWQYYFPTDIERWMWRASCATIAGVGGACACGFAVPLTYYRLPRGVKARLDRHLLKYKGLASNDDENRTWFQRVLKIFLNAFLSIFGIVFGTVMYLSGFCRLFLLIEAFISLRSQPSSAYEDPGWTDLIPHL